MKKIIFLITLGFCINSCDPIEETTYSYEVNPVFQVDMPTKFATDSITKINVRYKRPSSCHIFDNFYYEAEGFQRTVAIETIKVNQSNCQTDNQTIVEMPLKFRPIAEGTFHFKFWTGTNSAGVDQYLEYDVVVDH